MDKEEIIRRLKKISEHAVHVVGEPPFIMSLDDGIALNEAVRLLEEQEVTKSIPPTDESDSWIIKCLNCNKYIVYRGQMSCPNCGSFLNYIPGLLTRRHD